MIAEFIPLIIAAIFAGIMLIFALLYLVSRKTMPRTSSEQKKTFACGEEIKKQELNIPAESFYSGMIKTLRFDAIRRWHSGNLTSYMITIVLGMILMIMYLMYVW